MRTPTLILASLLVVSDMGVSLTTLVWLASSRIKPSTKTANALPFVLSKRTSTRSMGLTRRWSFSLFVTFSTLSAHWKPLVLRKSTRYPCLPSLKPMSFVPGVATTPSRAYSASLS